MFASKRVFHTFGSVLLFFLFVYLLSFASFDGDFVGLGLVILTETCSLGVGFLLILIRLFKVPLNRYFIYNFFGILNAILFLFVGNVGIKSELAVFIEIAALNLMVAAFILGDIFFKIRFLQKSNEKDIHINGDESGSFEN